MNKDPKIFLLHVRDACEAIENYIRNLSENEFYENKEKQDAIVRELEIIGEAVRNLPTEFKEANTHIPWVQISSMRNFLIHEYFSVDLDLVWDTVKEKIPSLKEEIIKLI
ncbi:MAG: DUF86 domain-containing protein [Patescibacteria group bacterium]